MDAASGITCTEDGVKITCTADVAGTAFTYGTSVIDTAAPSAPTNTLPNGTTVNTDGWDFTWNASTDNLSGTITYEYQASQNPAVDGSGVLTT